MNKEMIETLLETLEDTCFPIQIDWNRKDLYIKGLADALNKSGKDLLAIYARENEIARDKNTEAKILGAAEYARLIGMIDDHEYEFYKMKYQKSAP